MDKSMFNFESTSFSDFTLAAGRLSKHIFAVIARNDRLSMTKHYICLIASTAFYIHKVRVGCRD